MNLLNLFSRFPTALAQGLIYGIMALGVYITFRILKISDLTVDGSFATGGAAAVMAIIAGASPIVALLLAFITGLLCGAVTALLNSRLKIPTVLASILVQLALYSVNLKIQKGSALIAVSVDRYNLLISSRNLTKSNLTGLLLTAVIIAILYWFFGTETGCAIRATGNNQAMARANGINPAVSRFIGLSMANGLVGFAGGLLAQLQGFTDVSMGRGAIVIGLAAIIIGEVLHSILIPRNFSFMLRLIFVIVGGIIYYMVMVIILWMHIDSNDLKLFTALIVAAFFAAGNLKNKGGFSNAED